MTAVDVDALDKLRDRLAAALLGHRYDSVGRICACGTECGVVCDNLTREQHLADALLPVVDRIANERAAAELRAAAKVPVGQRVDPLWLRARADALDPT